ncbi:MAG: respiratory nitrate reductase subunit gamma [Nocardioidaceae bacterium]
MALFALWPFTRLVHVFSAPLGYLTRPYIVYRSRDDVILQPRKSSEQSADDIAWIAARVLAPPR